MRLLKGLWLFVKIAYEILDIFHPKLDPLIALVLHREGRYKLVGERM